MKPPKPVSEKTGRALVAARSAGVCEVCARARATNVHHRKGRRIYDPWRPSNLLHLCGSGTTGCHGEITEHKLPVYRDGYMIRRHMSHEPHQIPAYLWRDELGPSWCWLHDDGTTSSVSMEEIYEFAEGRG